MKRFPIPKEAKGDTPMFALRLPAETREAVDRWAAAQQDKPGRSEAIRRLLNHALAVTPQRAKRRTAKPGDGK